MAGGNCTPVTEFILWGFMDHSELQVILFFLFLVIYVITLMGNLGMILLITANPRLHTPMYFFLSNLSFVDFCYSSAIAPKALQTFLAERKTIPYAGCAAQMFLFTTFLTTECYLLAAMAYDRYMAICNPLLYVAIMSPRICTQLVAGSYFIGLIGASVQTSGAFRLSYCGSNVINHFFCDVPAVVKLSCSHKYISELVLFVFSGIIAASTISIILVSYLHILSTILRIRSMEGRRKAFSTCASHLAVVTVFYGTAICIYLLPQSDNSLEQGKIFSVFYTLVIPMLNPLIYSLRNKDVKDALRSTISLKMHSEMFL